MHYLLYGANAVDLDDRSAAILAELDPSGIGISRLEAPVITADDLAASVNVPPFFGGARVVVLTGLFDVRRATAKRPAASDDDAEKARGSSTSSRGINWDQAEAVILGAPETTVIVMRQDGEIRSNSRAIKQAKKLGWHIERFPLLYGRELVGWADERANSEGFAFVQNTVSGLLDRLFPGVWQAAPRGPQELAVNTRLLATEITKLACAAEDGEVGADAIAALVADRNGFTAFKLNDETYEGRTTPALVELDHVIAAGEAPEKVLGQLAQQAAAFNAAGLANKFGPDTVAGASGISAGQIGLTVSRKNGWRNRPAVRRAAESLRRGEWLVKTGRTRRTESVIVPIVGEIAEAFKSRSERRDQRS